LVWREAEARAASHLEEAGYAIVVRNWRDRRGELDIIAVRGDVIAIVEVRGQIRADWVAPEDTVGPAKRAQVCATARRWLAHNAWAQSGFDIRFDVIGVVVGGAALRHVERAFIAEQCAPFAR
jgi:putative endonuclease